MNSQREKFEKFVIENWGGSASLERDPLFPEAYELPSRNWWFHLWQAATEQGVGEPSGVWQFYQNGEWHVGSNTHPPKPTGGGVPDNYANHWAVKNPGRADQHRAESLMCRTLLGFDKDSEEVSPRDLSQEIISLMSSRRMAGQYLSFISELYGELERAIPPADESAEAVVKSASERIAALLATQQPPEQE